MKNLSVLVLLAMVQSSPASARYQLAELLKPGTHSADLMTLGLDPSLKGTYDKFAAALKDPAIMKDLAGKLKPGQPMPYDARFGFSEAEYKRFQEGLNKMQLIATGKKANLVIEHAGDTIIVKSDACSLLKGGAKFDKSMSTLSLAGHGAMKGNYFENRSTPLAPLDGFSFQEIKETPFSKVSLTAGRRVGENYCLIDCDVSSAAGREAALLRYDCVSAAAAPVSTAASVSNTAAPAPASPAENALAELDRIAKAKEVAPAPVAAPPAEKKNIVSLPVVQGAPPPAHDPNKVKVPVRATGKSPASVCRAALSRYPVVSPSMYARCKDANEFSSHAVNVYTYIYKGGMADSLLVALLRINNAEKEECAIQIAKQYAGTMTTKYLEDTCL
jgi:hypothetical protein